jgi:hypothetical protein
MKHTPLKRKLFKFGKPKPLSRGVLAARKRRAAEKKVYKENEAIWSELVKLRAHYQTEKSATQMQLLEHPSRRLNSHHFLPKGLYPSLRWDLRNGLCIYSWQHVRARGSAHADAGLFDEWALPYLFDRGDIGYLRNKSIMPGKIGPVQIAEANVRLKGDYRKATGCEWKEKKDPKEREP